MLIGAHGPRLCPNWGFRLSTAWQTDLGQPEEMAGAMVLVGLPPTLGSTEQAAAALRATLLRNGIQIQYPTLPTSGPPRLYGEFCIFKNKIKLTRFLPLSLSHPARIVMHHLS